MKRRQTHPWLIVTLIFLSAGLLAIATWSSEAVAKRRSDVLAPIRAQAPRCPADVRHCFGLRLHVVVKGGKPVQTAPWIARQLREANQRFKATGVGFELVEARRLPRAMARIRTRADRDRLGARRTQKGLIDVFLVKRLDNVDAPGEINGVHWRNRTSPGQRYVIMSSIAWHVVLAHELGHFFGLPHSEYPASIMNKKRSDDRPPLEDWGFHADEQAIIEKRRVIMLRQGVIKDRTVSQE